MLPKLSTLFNEERLEEMGNFLAATRQNYKTYGAVPLTTGTVQPSVSIPQSGLGAGLTVLVSGTVTAAAGGGATQATYPYTPWSFIKRFRIYSAEGLELY